jgi:uncharacterized membrane protein
MEIIIPLIIIIAILSFIFSFFYQKIEDFFIATESFWSFLGSNIFMVVGFICFGLAVFVFFYLKPHPAEKHFNSYKEGKISRAKAIELISDEMYDSQRDNIPLAYKSKILEKRIQALRKRIKSETEFMEDLIRYLRRKSEID